MPYMTRRPMKLAGTFYQKGSIVPDELVATIPPGRLRSLISTGLFLEVAEEYQAPEAPPAQEQCPVCGESFKRLAQHITMKHETTEALQEALLDES